MGAVTPIKILKVGLHFINYRRINIVKKQWLAKIKREGKLPKPENCFVCSDHFRSDDYERDLKVCEILQL